MIPRDTFLVARDGQPLSAVSRAIRVVDVTEMAAARTLRTQQRGNGPDSFVIRDDRSSLAVRIQFAVLEEDCATRTVILSRVAQWARSGTILTLGDRPGKQLACICTALPQTQSRRKWAGLCEMTFTAYRVPFWEDELPMTAEATSPALQHKIALAQPGTYPAPLTACITAHGAVSELSIAAGGSECVFSGLALEAGGQFTLTHEDGLPGAFCTSAGEEAHPCLSAITADSADELLLPPGETSIVTVTADGPVTVRLCVRGRYD